MHMNTTIYIATLSEAAQASLRNKLQSEGLNPQEVETAMSGRLCDLSDTINYTKEELTWFISQS